jgi:hypothetical protein
MEKLGIGLRVHFVPLSDIDFDLLESLGDSGQRTRREQPERDRGPRHEARSGRMERGREAVEPGALEHEADDDAITEEQRAVANDGGQDDMELDLLDPEAAEASRLSSDAQDWNDDETDADERDEVGDDDGEAERTARAVDDEDDVERERDDDEREDAPSEQGRDDEDDDSDDSDDEDDDEAEDLSASSDESGDSEREPSGEKS